MIMNLPEGVSQAVVMAYRRVISNPTEKEVISYLVGHPGSAIDLKLEAAAKAAGDAALKAFLAGIK